MLLIEDFINNFSLIFQDKTNPLPWNITSNLKAFIEQKILKLDNNYTINDTIAIHKTAIGANAVLSPGTVLVKNTIVKRLELIEQLK